MIIEFSTDNAAFDDERVEVVRILQLIAARVENGDVSGVIRDSNGNRVGQWNLTD
jgi:hypothetical protein